MLLKWYGVKGTSIKLSERVSSLMSYFIHFVLIKPASFLAAKLGLIYLTVTSLLEMHFLE